MTRLGLRTASCLLAFVACLFAAPGGSADNYYPLLTVEGHAHLLGEENDLVFNLEYLSSAGDAERVTIQTPPGFAASLAEAPGTNLGTAGLGLLPAGTNISASKDASIGRYTGSLLVLDPATFAADPNAQACAPGTHTAVWQLKVTNVASGVLTIPIAVDAHRGGYQLTVCFDALQTAGKEVEYAYFTPMQVFRNPVHQGRYLFDGVVTPFAGNTGSTAAYELRAYQPLPQDLDAVATYVSKAKTLTVTGTLSADGAPRAGLSVDVYGATSANAVHWTDLGATRTRIDGSYTFVRKFGAFHDSYVYTQVSEVNQPTCAGASPEPAGCAATSTDGRASHVVRIASR